MHVRKGEEGGYACKGEGYACKEGGGGWICM